MPRTREDPISVRFTKEERARVERAAERLCPGLRLSTVARAWVMERVEAEEAKEAKVARKEQEG